MKTRLSYRNEAERSLAFTEEVTGESITEEYNPQIQMTEKAIGPEGNNGSAYF